MLQWGKTRWLIFMPMLRELCPPYIDNVIYSTNAPGQHVYFKRQSSLVVVGNNGSCPSGGWSKGLTV